jgi:ribulose-phosphate 3-epimerase
MRWSEWTRPFEIEPSLYGGDFANLGSQIETLLGAGCRVFHFDVGDGHFVEPITMGPIVLQSIAPLIHAGDGVIDVHLMVETPAKYFEAIAAAGGDSVTFHYEAVDDVSATIRAAHEYGLQAGIAFNPETEPEDVAAAAGDADLVLCMSIHPGYSGQPFLEAAYERLRRIRAALAPQVLVQVDGGISQANVRAAHDAGATLLVAASAIFGHEDLAGAYERLVQAIA